MDIVKYGMHLAKTGVESYFQSTASNMKDLRESIKIVKDTISKESTSAKEEFGKIKNGEQLRSIKEWFFSEADSLDYDDSSDFDPGYDTTATAHSSNVESMEDAPSVQASVTPEAFANINGKQTAAMYKIAAKQADVSALSTAEITTTIRRSNETSIASMNEIKKAIGMANKKLDDILGAINETNKLIMKTPMMLSQTQSPKEIKNDYSQGVYQNGTINLERLMQAGKSNNFGMSGISGMMSMIPMMLQGGPSGLVSLGIESLLDHIKPGGVFGKKSIHEGIKSVDEMAGAFAESFISELSSTKAFKQIFGDVNSFAGDKDYSKSVNNQYNTKPALFDGMTRTTIIDTIPSLLRLIHEDLSHEKTHIDNRGQVKSGTQKNYFKEVTKESFNSSSLLSFDNLNSYTQVAKGANVNISSSDMNTAAKALSMAYVMELHRTGTHLRDSQLVNNGMMMANKVVSILVRTTGKSEVFWSDVVLTLITQLQSNPVDAHNFVKAVNENLSKMINAAETFAQTSMHANQASKLTLSDATDIFKNEYESLNPKNNSSNNNNNPTPTVSRSSSNVLSTPDYVRGIFGILNRGINVRVMDSNKPFRPYKIKSQSPENPTIEQSSSANNNDYDRTNIGEGGTKTYIDNILDSIVPKSIRMSMQTFGRRAQDATDRLGLTETDANGKRHFISQNTRDSINEFLSPFKEKMNKISNLLIGEKEEIENDDGTKSTKRTGGIYQGAKDRVKNGLNNAKNAIGDAVSSRLDDISYKRLQRDVDRMDTSNDDAKNDQLLAQQVFSMMETVMTDGDGSATDVSAIMEIVEQIKNSKLKSNIRRSIDKIITKKAAISSDESGGKLGGIAGKILSAMGKIFSPLRLAISGIKTVVGKFFSFYKKSFKSGITHLYTGIKSMGQGLFGSKKDGEDGLIKKVLQKPLNAVSKVLDKVKNIGSSLIKNISGFFNRFSGFFSRFKTNSTDTTSTTGDDGSSDGQQNKGALGKLGDKIRSTEFGKGFMQSFDEANQIRSRNKATASTKADWYTMDILNVLQDKGSQATNTVFDKIIDRLEDINKSVIRVDDSVDAFKTAYKTEEDSDDLRDNSQSTTRNLSANLSGATSTVSSIAGSAATTAAAGGAAAAAAGGTVAKSAGKFMGGAASVILALVEILGPIVLAMEGIQTILDSVKGLLSAIIEPLAPVFDTLGEMLEPILKTLGEMLEPVMIAVSGVIEAVLPILDILEPVLKAIGPALDIVSTTLVNTTKFILTPIMEAVVATIVPVLNIISGAVQVLLGVVQSIWGVLNYGLGQLIYGIGKLSGSNTIQQFGKEMVSSGANNIESGTQSMKDGWYLLTHPSMMDEEEKEEDIELVRGEYKPVESSGSALDGVVGSGDVYNNTDSHNSSIINNYYGNGDQSSYGSYLNMGQRGCGPLALAENISRRTGSSVNPKALASGMYNSGMYEPDKGTSVSNYMRASSAMGVNLTPGGVTPSSLRMASPNNPITLIGSGTGYGTRGGNNHFINALGTTPYGQTIVSNPLTGRVGRISTSSLVANTRLGLYGSGNEEEQESAMVEAATSEDDTTQTSVDATTSENASSGDGDLYDSLGFSEETKSAVAKLTNITSKLLSIFDFGENDEEKALNQAKADATANRLEQVMGENAETYEKIARSNFEKEYPKENGESDAEYETRWNNVRIKYLTEAVNAYDSVTVAKYGNGTITEEEMKTRSENLDSTSLLDKLANIISGLDAEDAASSSSSSSNPYTSTLGGQFASDQGVVLATQGYTPTIFKNNLTSSSSTESPLHEWFANTCGDPVTSSTSWYSRYNSPTGVDGVGTSGSAHQGIDINTQHDSSGTIPIYPTCDGVVTIAKSSDSAGNYVAWTDKAGYRHRIMHMAKFPNVAVGEQIKGGETLLGYIGTTGQSSGPHIHYDIYKDGGNGGHVNPFTYFKYIPPKSSGGATMYGDDITEQIYSYLVTGGMSGIGASGLMGCFKYESGYRSNNLEDKFQSNWGYPSGEAGDEQYTKEVDSGAESERQFVGGRSTGICGYGIAQFTSSNLKQDLYDKTVKQGKSISDLPTQLDAITAYLKTQRYNGQSLYDSINSSPTPTSANQKFLWRYEAGTSYNSDGEVAAAYPWMGESGIKDRHNEAENIYKLYGNNSYQAAITSGGGNKAYGGSMTMPNTQWFNKYKNNFNKYYANQPGLRDVFMPAALASDLTFPEIALVLSTGIWEDGGKKLFGTKSLTNTTYDYNGQQAVGIMNWVDKSVAQKYPTMEGQLNYMKQSYFSDNPTHARAYIQRENYNGQKSGYRNATGWNFTLNPGDRYAPTLNSNTSQGLIEGMTHFMGNALVPECRNSEDGIAKHAAVAVSAYNWMGENGYASTNVQVPSITNQPHINSPSDAVNLDYGQIDSSTQTNTTVNTNTNGGGKNIHGSVNKDDNKNTNKNNNNKNVNTGFGAALLKGSGDMPIYRDYDIPEIDMNQLFGTSYSDNAYYQSQQPIIIQSCQNNQEYNTQLAQKRYETILTNTYNVRAKELESLVMEIRDLVKAKKSDNSNQTSTNKNINSNSNNDLFSNKQIPDAITRLMRG